VAFLCLMPLEQFQELCCVKHLIIRVQFWEVVYTDTQQQLKKTLSLLNWDMYFDVECDNDKEAAAYQFSVYHNTVLSWHLQKIKCGYNLKLTLWTKHHVTFHFLFWGTQNVKSVFSSQNKCTQNFNYHTLQHIS